MATLTAGLTDIAVLPGLKSLWAETLGDPSICIAVLDGPVDQSHPCFKGTQLTQLQTLMSGVADKGWASQHGTHVASIIFGQPGSPVSGIASGCRGLVVPIFRDGSEGSLAPCSQIDLARAITQAVEQGAHVINISGGQLAPSGEPDSLLANAVRFCADNNVLIVAAAGNDRCDCLHVPAAIASVLAVGAMDDQGNPIDFSNWGEAYQSQGVLALGEHILGAIPGNGTALKSGTSFATPIVSGVVALLLSLQLKRGEKPDPHTMRSAILKSALPCNSEKSLDCRRFLAGILNIPGTQALIAGKEAGVKISKQKEEIMIQPSEVSQTEQSAMKSLEAEVFRANESMQINPVNPQNQLPIVSTSPTAGVTAASISPSMSVAGNPLAVIPSNRSNLAVAPSGVGGECNCGGGGSMQLVYALGELGYDFGIEARRDSIQQAMGLTNPPSRQHLLAYFAGEQPYVRASGDPDPHPWMASQIIWTLNLDATPIYAIVPGGAFASVTYDRLREFLQDENVERVSIPGYSGGSVRLASGQVVPAIIPAVQGMYSWSVEALLDVLIVDGTPQGVTRQVLQDRIREVLDRIYYDFRNLGVTPQERALNFAATNAFQLSIAISTASENDQVLDTIDVEKSPICRPDSDCYDVKLRFFNPENSRRARKVYRFTIDVSDVMPVTIGRMRSWSESE